MKDGGKVSDMTMRDHIAITFVQGFTLNVEAQKLTDGVANHAYCTASIEGAYHMADELIKYRDAHPPAP